VARPGTAKRYDEHNGAQEAKENAAHARFERELFTPEEDAMRRPLRGNAVEQGTKRLRLQASGKPERQDFLGLALAERFTLGLTRIDVEVAQGAVLVGRQLVLRQRFIGMCEESGAKCGIGNGALQHGLDCIG
jgi:hypothetical protein